MELLGKHVYIYERKLYIASANILKVYHRVVSSEKSNKGSPTH
jgi:hypothetical protein